MDTYNYIWGVIGCSFGICFTIFVMTIGAIIDDRKSQRHCKQCRESYEKMIDELKENTYINEKDK